jgi:aryl-phospho-beta-D-glucosidase BglC (GH1 family)
MCNAALALQGSININYIAPTQTALSYWIAQGANVFRLPFAWERLQATKGGAALDGPAAQVIDDIVTFLSARNVSVILDPHNNECGTWPCLCLT